MKKRALITVFFLSFFCIQAQELYTIDGQSIPLKTAVEGSLDLLWNNIDNRYRYFVRTEDQQLVELVNTKNNSSQNQEDYKTTLRELTNNKMEVADVAMTLPSLARFIDRYNSLINPDYVPVDSKAISEFRLGVFGGITNSPFVGNPANEKSAVIGGELEMISGTSKRHSGYFQIRHVAEKEAFQYRTTELSLGYRYRVVKLPSWSLYGDVKFATLNFSKATISYEDTNAEMATENINETAFDAPLIVGIGAEYRISPRIFATLSYNQLFAVFLKNQGNFSTDVTLGLKFRIN